MEMKGVIWGARKEAAQHMQCCDSSEFKPDIDHNNGKMVVL